jgi:hypothetical protein
LYSIITALVDWLGIYEIAFDAVGLFLLGVKVLFYASFFFMLYAYAYVEEKIGW